MTKKAWWHQSSDIVKKIKHPFEKKTKKINFAVYFFWGILVYALLCAGYVWFLFLPRFWVQDNLILLVNENEARPCGGFVTGFAEYKKIWNGLDIKNIYELDGVSFGNATGPLSKVSDKKYFWDLGESPNMDACSQNFLEKYNSIQNTEIQNIVMVQSGVISQLYSILGKEDPFAALSRDVSNVDRHNREALANRKSSMGEIPRDLLFSTLTKPWKILALSKELNRSVYDGTLYVSDLSPSIGPNRNDFALIEWNLGGGKSSRYLKKTLHVRTRQELDNLWKWSVTVEIEHLGGYDEPLSQDWKGVFVLMTPDFLGTKAIPIDIKDVIAPGGKFTKSYEFTEKSEENGQAFGVFSPPGHKTFVDLIATNRSQRNITSRKKFFNFKSIDTGFDIVRENVGIFNGIIEGGQHLFQWDVPLDNVAPFVTLHEKVSLADGTPGFFVEIHFNEPVNVLKNASAKLLRTDANGIQKNIILKENPPSLEPNKTTIILSFFPPLEHHLQREYLDLQLNGIEDLAGNPLDMSRGRTVVWD